MKELYYCHYCGYEEEKFVWMASSELKCSRCGDHNLKQVKTPAKSDVFGYKSDEAYRKRYPLE